MAAQCISRTCSVIHSWCCQWNSYRFCPGSGHSPLSGDLKRAQACGSRLSQASAAGNFSASPTCRTRPTTGHRARSTATQGPQEPLLATVERWKLAWFRHVARRDCVSKNRPWGHLEKVGDRYHDQQRKCCMDNIKKWTSLPMPELLTKASCRTDWKRISAKSSLMSPWWPNQSRDWTELNWTAYSTLDRGLLSHPQDGIIKEEYKCIPK